MVSFISPGALNRRTSTLRRRLATGMACSVRAFGGPHCAPHKIGIRHRASSELSRASCPGYGYARSSGIHAYRHAGEESLPRSGMHWNGYQRFGFSYFVPLPLALQSRLPHPRRSCSAYAGRDSLITRSDRHRLRYNADLTIE
jgi:hypothetical protein